MADGIPLLNALGEGLQYSEFLLCAGTRQGVLYNQERASVSAAPQASPCPHELVNEKGKVMASLANPTSNSLK